MPTPAAVVQNSTIHPFYSKHWLAGLAALVTLPGISADAAAVQFQHTPGGPSSAIVGSPVIATDSGALITTSGSGLYRSNDDGANWRPLKNSVAQLAQQTAFGGGKLYAISAGQVYQSSNDGDKWRSFQQGFGMAIPQNLTADDRFVYITAYTGAPDYQVHLLRSSHDIAAFSDKTPVSASVSRIAVAGSNLCALVSGSGLQYSADHGNSWSSSSGPQGDYQFLGVAPESAEAYLVSSGGALLYSNDGCKSFTARAGSGLPVGCNVNVTAFGVSADGTVYQAVQGNENCSDPMRALGIYKSSDQGAGFTADNGGAMAALSKSNVGIYALGQAGGAFFAGTNGSGLLMDKKGGWAVSDHGIHTAFVSSLSSRGKVGKLIAGISGGGIMISDDGGEHWNARNTGITDRNISAVLVGGTTLLAAAGGYNGGSIFRSADDGAHWSASSNGIAATDFSGSLGLAKSGNSWFALTGRKVFRSSDGGRSWRDVGGNLPATFYGRGIAANDDGVYVYSAGADSSAGVWRSVDQGKSWVQASDGLSGSFYGGIFAASKVLIASTGPNHLYYSLDKGNHWAPSSGYSTHDFNGPTIQAMSLTEDDNGYLYLGDEHAGLSVSTDDGASWTPSSQGLFRSSTCIQRIPALAFDGAKVYAGQGGAGVFVSAPAAAGALGDKVACTKAE